MINDKLQIVLQGIESAKDLKGVKFAYAMAKNKELIVRELKLLQEAINPTEEYNKYDKKRIELCEKHAEKDEKGKAKLKNNEYDIIDRKKFDEELEALRLENVKAVDARKVQIDEFNEVIKKESHFTPFMIAYEDVPQDITSEVLSKIIELVEEPKK